MSELLPRRSPGVPSPRPLPGRARGGTGSSGLLGASQSPATAGRGGAGHGGAAWLGANGDSIVLRAAALGLIAPAVGLLVLWVVTLAAWFAADGGTLGSTTDALRVGADAWLLGHHIPIFIDNSFGRTALTAAPLGLSLLWVFILVRGLGWVVRGHGGAEEQIAGSRRRLVAGPLAALVGTYSLACGAVAWLASTPAAAASPGRAALHAAVFSFVVSGASFAGRVPNKQLPGMLSHLKWTVQTAFSLLGAAACLLFAGSLLAHAPTAIAIGDELSLDVAGGALSVAVTIAILPNLILLAFAYLLGPGFAVGEGTSVSTLGVDLQTVPALPVLAALPDNGPAPAWVGVLIAVPWAVSALAGYLAGRVVPTRSPGRALKRGVAGGLLLALSLGVCVGAAGGSIGPGRMQTVGMGWGQVVAAVAVPMVVGSCIGTLAASWRTHKLGLAEHPSADRSTFTRAESVSLYTGRLADFRPVEEVTRAANNIERRVRAAALARKNGDGSA